MNKKSKFAVRLICVVLCVVMVGGLFTSALLSIIAERKAQQTEEIVLTEDGHDHDHDHEAE